MSRGLTGLQQVSDTLRGHESGRTRSRSRRLVRSALAEYSRSGSITDEGEGRTTRLPARHCLQSV